MAHSCVLVITGLQREVAIIRRALRTAGSRDGKTRVGVVCRGPGARAAGEALRAGMKAARQEGRDIRLCLSVGFAAALVPALEPGEIVMPNEVVAAPRRWSCARLAEPTAGPPLVPVARLAEAAEPLTDPRGKAWLHLTSGAVAADMESAALARACAEEGIAFAVLRVISDGASHRLPACVTDAVDAEGRLHMGRLLGGLALRPHVWRDFARLACAGRRAERGLGRLGATLPQIALPFLV